MGFRVSIKLCVHSANLSVRSFGLFSKLKVPSELVIFAIDFSCCSILIEVPTLRVNFEKIRDTRAESMHYTGQTGREDQRSGLSSELTASRLQH